MDTGRIYNTKKIAVLRANQLGDFVVAQPALQAIKNAYPEAELVLLAKPWTKEYLSRRPSPADRVVAVPVSEGVRIEEGMQENGAEMNMFFEAMKRERFDIAVQLHGGGRHSNRFVKSLGARLTVGSKTPDAQPLDRTIPYNVYQNEIFRYLEIVSLIGARCGDVAPHITVLPTDIHEFRKNFPGIESPYVVLHPGASDPLRRWEPVKFATIADRIAQMGYRIVITGIPSEKKIVDEVMAKMESGAVNTCGLLTLNALTGLLSEAALLISNDTGPVHLAQAVGTKTVGLYWAYNAISWGPTTSRGNYVAISWMTHCPVCNTKLTSNYNEPVHFPACPHRFSLISPIQPEEVLYYASELLRR